MKWEYKTPGIPEESFCRGNVPITKTEVRVLTLSKLKLKEDHTVLDIGCGTGSVTVEMALQCSRGKVVAVDQNEEAVKLTQANQQHFELSNIEALIGEAPDVLPDVLFDRIFIGGGSKKIDQIIEYAQSHLNDNGILAANTILLDSTYLILKALEKNNFREIECISVNIARGHYQAGWMMKANNPIYIISAMK